MLGVPMWLGRIIALLAFGVVWELLSRLGLINPLFIGNPIGIIVFFFKGLFVTHELVAHLLWTLAGTLAAFALGSVTGILIGLLFVAYPKVEQFIDPIFAGLNALPRIALAPLFLLWFGLGISSKIALGFSLTFFIVLSSTVAGGRGVNPDHITLARTLGASESQIFRKFVLPSAVPVIFNGLRLGLVFALLGVIGAEIFASEHGLGQTLSVLAASFKTNGVFGIIFLLSMIGVGISWGMTSLENRLLRWR